MISSTAIHGGDVDQIASEFGVPAAAILDFSANINPRGLPAGARERLLREASCAWLMARYPDPYARELTQELGRYLGVPPENIVVAEGAGALIFAAVRAFQPSSCLILSPAFAEYERACAALGCAVCFVPLDSNDDFRVDLVRLSAVIRSGRHDLLILNSPHNPSGSVLDRDLVRGLLDIANDANVNVLLDEAFIDYAAHCAVTSEAASRSGVISVRSLTKFYGCPALRVGYAVGNIDNVRRITTQLPAWPVSTLVGNALAEALRDADYRRITLDENERERAWLRVQLQECGLHVFPSAVNFLLFRTTDGLSSGELTEKLIREQRIAVRNCDSFRGLEGRGYIRVAVRNRDENNRLVDAIRNVLGARNG